nr:MAG TPA: hypothetical protein [Caudoviricetes sp.]
MEVGAVKISTTLIAENGARLSRAKSQIQRGD